MDVTVSIHGVTRITATASPAGYIAHGLEGDEIFLDAEPSETGIHLPLREGQKYFRVFKGEGVEYFLYSDTRGALILPGEPSVTRDEVTA
jgi:hypothetical protein